MTERKNMIERAKKATLEFGTKVGIASGEIYLGYLMLGIFPLGTIAGAIFVYQGVEKFKKTLSL